MKESTRLKKHDEMLAQLLGKTPEEIQAAREFEEADSKFREAQAIHLFLEKPHAFTSKKCQECGGQFLTSYKFVSICSTNCMRKSLEKIGIDWNPLRTSEERWRRAQIPMGYVVPPKALKILLKIASEVPPDTELSNSDSHTDLDSELLELETDGS